MNTCQQYDRGEGKQWLNEAVTVRHIAQEKKSFLSYFI
jgi:hypothetical protein